MNFLLDTNVVSEWTKPRPNPGVLHWLAEVDEDRAFLSVISLAELRHGVDRMAAGTRRDRLHLWVQGELPLRFEGRVLSVHAGVADAWGRLMAQSQLSGRSMSVMDSFLAATSQVYDLTLVTRNVDDFAILGSCVLNPWTA